MEKRGEGKEGIPVLALAKWQSAERQQAEK